MDDDSAAGSARPSPPGRGVDPAEPDPSQPSARSRRAFLVGGGLGVAAAIGGGVALGLSTGTSDSGGPLRGPIPEELRAAVSAELALIATVDAALQTARARPQAELRLIRADHVAHLTAINGLISDAMYPAVPQSAAASPPTPANNASANKTPAKQAPSQQALSRAAVRSAEQRSASAAAARALRLSGPAAAVLASIAASEAAHAELLA